MAYFEEDRPAPIGTQPLFLRLHCAPHVTGLQSSGFTALQTATNSYEIGSVCHS